MYLSNQLKNVTHFCHHKAGSEVLQFQTHQLEEDIPFYCKTDQIVGWRDKRAPQKGLRIPNLTLQLSQPSRTVELLSIGDS